MGPGAAFAILLVVAGALVSAGGLVLVGVLLAMVLALRSVWSRYGFRALEYERHLSTSRVPWGERAELDLVVRNAKLLPLPWLQIDDFVTHGADLGDRQLTPSVRQGFDVMRQTWSIGWFERVTRRLPVIGSRRGTFRFTSTELRIADLFGSENATMERSMVDHLPGGAADGPGPLAGQPEPDDRGEPNHAGACTKTRRCSRASGRTSRAISRDGSTGRRPRASAAR